MNNRTLIHYPFFHEDFLQCTNRLFYFGFWEGAGIALVLSNIFISLISEAEDHLA